MAKTEIEKLHNIGMYKYFNWPLHGPTYMYQPRSYQYIPLHKYVQLELPFWVLLCFTKLMIVLRLWKASRQINRMNIFIVFRDNSCCKWSAVVCLLNKCWQSLISLSRLINRWVDWFRSSMDQFVPQNWTIGVIMHDNMTEQYTYASSAS